jgi:hypothetical protein
MLKLKKRKLPRTKRNPTNNPNVLQQNKKKLPNENCPRNVEEIMKY